MKLSAPFPWFGGKSTVAAQVWAALGDVDHYIEPFFGSGAVLLARPHAPRMETVNDLDGFLANFWRAVRKAPDEVAHYADWPVNEADLHARHLWLLAKRGEITSRLMGDPDFCDVKVAGWWVWGASSWIGSGWCSGNGPWVAVDGEMVDSRQLPHLSGGQGVNRKLPGDAITEWFVSLSARLRGVRVACGEWDRVTGPSVRKAGGGVCGVFLDPPYAMEGRSSVYAIETDAATAAQAWCRENGNNPALRIVLAGYDGEHNGLESLGWKSVSWKAQGGYGAQGEGRGRENAGRERLWMSPHCLGVKQDMFAELMA